jgi:hypothetical protein
MGRRWVSPVANTKLFLKRLPVVDQPTVGDREHTKHFLYLWMTKIYNNMHTAGDTGDNAHVSIGERSIILVLSFTAGIYYNPPIRKHKKQYAPRRPNPIHFRSLHGMHWSAECSEWRDRINAICDRDDGRGRNSNENRQE